MSDTKPRRGRPKGTGIDDRHWLSKIDLVRELHPEMRVTTIIRKVFGIENKSTIRRLRDKHKLARARAPISGHHHHARPAPAFAGRSYSPN